MDEQTVESRIRVVLLDCHALFRVSLGCFLTAQPGLEVVGECGASTEAMDVLKRSQVDLVLLDFNIGSERWNEFVSAARRAGYEGRFLVVTGSADPRDSALALKLAVSGIFLKSESPERLVQAIRVVAGGDLWVDQGVIRLLAEWFLDEHPQLAALQDFESPLQERERKVLLGILGGLTNRRIGGNIGLSESSVKGIVHRLYAKAGVKRRSQLVRVALEGSLGSNPAAKAHLLDKRTRPD